MSNQVDADLLDSLIKQWKEQIDSELHNSLTHIKQSAPQSTLGEFWQPIEALSRGGKRYRGILLALAYYSFLPLKSAENQKISEPETASEDLGEDFPAQLPATLLYTACALELYQLHALIHDDIADNSTLRRRKPTAHVSYAQQKSAKNPAKNSAEIYGTGAAIFAGDLLIALANYELTKTSLELSSSTFSMLKLFFEQMTMQVTLGQILDLNAEYSPEILENPEALIESAFTVISHKTASYSVIFPLLMGALSALDRSELFTDELVAQLQKLGEDAGTAFQLRDDDLGLFGSTEKTGKPVADDLREGKLTVLLGLALENCSQPARTQIIETLGNPKASADEISSCLQQIKRSGAISEHEAMISHLLGSASNQVQQLSISDTAKKLLTLFLTRLVNRQA